jgi:hypothetical protein
MTSFSLKPSLRENGVVGSPIARGRMIGCRITARTPYHGSDVHCTNSLDSLYIDASEWQMCPENFVSSRGIVKIVREDARSPTDNQKLAVKQLQSMLDKSEEIASREKEEVEYDT